MANVSVQTLTMTAYTVMENYKHLQFVVFLLLYVATVSLNAQLVAVICHHKDLHRPMHVFTCVLLINEIYGSTALLPATMSVLLSHTYQISLRWCKTQIFFLHTYASAELCILALMGYDRYVAVCYPLHYHAIMSHSRVCALVALVCLYPIVVFTSYYSLTLQLKICGRVIPKLYCVNMELVKNSCSSIAYISIAGLVLLFLFIVPQVLMVLFSYGHIFKVCRKLPKNSQAKALKTCAPHLLSLTNYTVASFFEIIQTRFDMSHVAVELRILLSVYFLVIPPLVNPLLYGFGTQDIRVHIFRMLVKYKEMVPKRGKTLAAT